MSAVPDYSDQQGLRQIVDRGVPDFLTELWGALEKAWEDLEEAESKIENLEEKIENLEGDLEEVTE